MKFPFRSDPNDKISIIEPTEEAMDEYGYNYGSDIVELSNKHIEVLKNGKMLAWNNGEYTTFLILTNNNK